MPFKVTVPKKIENLLKPNSKEGLVAQTRKQFSKRGTTKVKQAIVQDLIRGFSPVKGKSKFAKYSQSYKDVIKNRAAYRSVNGKIVRFAKSDAATAFGVTNKEFASLRPSKQARKTRSSLQKGIRAKIKELNADFHSRSSPTKQISPVNLRHSGGLHRSLRVFTKGGFLRNFRMVTQFRSKLADIHNRRGAGKSKAVRRLLPTNRGERFNIKIERVIFKELSKAADYVAKQFSRQ